MYRINHGPPFYVSLEELAPCLASLMPSCCRASEGLGPVAVLLAHFAMATTSLSACCRPEEHPFLLLESTHRAVQEILRRRGCLPLLRSWIAQHYSEEVITQPEEKVLPAIPQCLAWVNELNERLLAEQALLQRCQMEADRRVRGALRLAMV